MSEIDPKNINVIRNDMLFCKDGSVFRKIKRNERLNDFNQIDVFLYATGKNSYESYIKLSLSESKKMFKTYVSNYGKSDEIN